jgi:hypothetical protein
MPPTSLSRRLLILATLSLLAAPAIVRAQPAGGPPPIELSVRTRAIANSDLGGGGASVSQSSTGFATKVPFPIGGGINGSLDLSLDLFELKFDDFNRTALGTASPLRRGRLATISPGLSSFRGKDLILFASPQWEFSGASGAGTGDATRWSATAGAIWFYRPGLTLVGGFVFSERLGYSTRYLPIAGFDWKIDDTWSLALSGSAADYQAPVLKLTRTLNPTTRVFAQLGFEDGQVRLASDSSIPDGYLRYESFVPQVGVTWQATPALNLAVFGGLQLAQKYEFKNRAKQTVLRQSADAAAVFGLRLEGKF